MAQFLDKDPYSYDKERQAFVNELRLFHTRMGTPLLRLPSIAGKELDLYLLYKKVIALGGLAKIYDDEQWEEILSAFNLPASCCHAAFALRTFYVKYLEAYEKIHHQGEDTAEVIAAHKSTVPSGQMQGSNHIPDKLRAHVGLSTARPRITDYDKIIHSLRSGLPNEVDFAINVCTLLSNEGKHVIHLERAPHLIDLLLAHVGVFFEGPGSLRLLYEEDWMPSTDRNFIKYWYDTVQDSEVREVVGPEPFKPKGDIEYKEGELFCGRSQGIDDVERQRIMQISIILRNLSFEKHNRRVMAAHRTLYRFLLLCVHNSDSALKQIGIDALSNIAADFILDPIDYRSTQLMFHTIDKGMKDPDRVVVLRAMEVLQKLSKVQTNLETLKMCLEERVYKAIVQMLIVHDVQLLLGALEVLLALSQTGEIICTKIAKVDKSIDILVCLITLDAQSLGAEAFVGIKIVDHAPHGIHHPVVTMARYQGRALPQTPPPSQGPPMPVARPSTPHQDRTATPPPPQPQNIATPSSTASRAAESENFAKQWLHATFEPKTQGSVSRIDLYSDYLAACSKMTSGSILNSNIFATCIRNCYPNIGFKQVQETNGTQYHITGIQKRAVPLPMKWQKQAPPQQVPNYTMQVGNSQNSASNIIASLARRHSPTGIAAPSPPAARMTYQMNSVQQSMVKSTSQQMPLVNSPGQQMHNQQQFPQRQQVMMPSQEQAVLPGRPPPQASPAAYQPVQGAVNPNQTNYIPQTVLQRPPASHMPSLHSPIANPKSPRSRSKSPKPSSSNPGTPQPSPALPPQSVSPSPAPSPLMSRGEMSPGSDITNDSSSRSSPATVIIGGALPQEKCQPPSHVTTLPEGEVRIQKVPNLHAQLLQQAAKKAQQQLGNPAVPLPLQVQQQQGVEVQPGVPSPDNGLALNPLPNPLGLQQQMQQAMEAAAAASTVPVPPPPTNGPYTNHSSSTTQYVAIQPKPSKPVPSSSQPQQQLPNQQQQPLQVNAMSPQQNQMQLLVINRPQQPGSAPQPAGGSYNQVRPQQQPLPNQFPRLATQIPLHNTSQANTDSPLIKRLLQTGMAVQSPARVSPPTRVSPPQQMVQPNQNVPMPNNSQWAGPNQTMPQVLPSQGFNQTTQQQQPIQQQIQQQNVAAGYMNNNNANMMPQSNMMPNHQNATTMHRPSPPPPPLPTVNEQLQQHREQKRQMQQIQQQHPTTLPQQNIQPCNNMNNGNNQHDVNSESKKMNGPTSTPALISPNATTNGPKMAESNETPKCNGTSQEYNSVSNDPIEKMEVDPFKKAAIKPVESLLKQHLVNGYASDSDMPIRNDIVTVNRVEEVEKTSGILEAALSIAGIEPDSDSRTSSGTSTPSDKLLASAKDNNGPVNHMLNGEILCDRNKTVGETNLNQVSSNGITMIISNNGSGGVAPQDPTNIPKQQSMIGGKPQQPVNQLILCSRDIRENLPPNLHLLPNNYNNNNQQQQAGTVVAPAAAAAPQGSSSNTSGSVQLVTQTVAAKQPVQLTNTSTAVSRNNTVQVQGALITVQQPPQAPPVQQQTNRQPVTLQLQQPNSNVQQLVVTTQHPQQQQSQQLAVNMQQQTLIVRPVQQPQQQQQQTMNIQVQNPNGQMQQQVIRLPVSIQGGQQQIVSLQRPAIQAGQQTQQQSMFIVNMPTTQNRNNASTMPAPSSVSTKSLKRSSDSSSSKDSSKVNSTVDGSSSSSSHHHKEKKEKKSKHHSSSKKKRKSSSSSHQSSCKKSHSSSSSSSTDQSKSSAPAMICMCEWRGCRRSFSTPKALHVHTSTVHVMGRNYRMMCEWEGCDHIQRQKWSCVSHILDKHCSQQTLKAAQEKRAKKALNSSASNDVVSGPTQPPVVYNAHNAYHAIRRSLHSPSLKDLLGETEGPVTKSIRLTASLVLKNLASRSEHARRLIRKHESHLARLAISQAEASTTLAKCILELNRRT